MRRRDFGAPGGAPGERPTPRPQRRARPPAEGSAFLRDLPETPPPYDATPISERFAAEPTDDWTASVLPPLDSSALDSPMLDVSPLDQPAPKRPRKPRKPRAPRASASASSPSTDGELGATDSGLWAISPYMGDDIGVAPIPSQAPTPDEDAHVGWESEPEQSSPSQSGRQRARRLRPEDTALVEQTTQIIRGLELVRDDATAAHETTLAPWERSTEHLPVTLVAGGGSARMAALHPKAPRRRHKGLLAGMVACVLCLTAVGTLLYTNRTVSGQAGNAQALLISAARLTPGAKDQNPGTPSVWNTSAGALSLGIGGGAGPGTKAPGSAGLPVKNPPKPSGSSPGGVDVLPAPLSPWPPYAWVTVPGYSSFYVAYPADGYYGWSFGQCTWWAQNKRRDENLRHMGNAQYWAGGAAGRGYTISSAPKPEATVVFQPGVQGAGGAGHVAHVEAVYPDGWFLVSEMNFYWNGGGWGRVDYRYVHSGWGVQFIY